MLLGQGDNQEIDAPRLSEEFRMRQTEAEYADIVAGLDEGPGLAGYARNPVQVLA